MLLALTSFCNDRTVGQAVMGIQQSLFWASEFYSKIKRIRCRWPQIFFPFQFHDHLCNVRPFAFQLQFLLKTQTPSWPQENLKGRRIFSQEGCTLGNHGGPVHTPTLSLTMGLKHPWVGRRETPTNLNTNLVCLVSENQFILVMP